MPLTTNRISTAEYTRADLASDGSCENNKPRPSTLTTATTPRSSPLFLPSLPSLVSPVYLCTAVFPLIRKERAPRLKRPPEQDPPLLQVLRARDDGTVLDSRDVAAGQVAVGGHVPVEPGEELDGAGGLAPVAHEVADDAEERDHLDAGALHAAVGDVADQGGGGPRGLDVGPDAVPGVAQGQRGKGSAHVRHDAGQDHLLLARRLDGLAELGVVPGVDLAVALDDGVVGVHVQDVLGGRAVGACCSGMLIR